jgi:glycosyltransferase involved in cell wall biosynthesis
MTIGVSVAICTHNGAPRLPQALLHLAAQVVPESVPWEVLVVDNASTDDTAEVARRSWPSGAPAPMRIVPEPALGLGNARRRGLAEAMYELVSFVDDDNWVTPSWVAAAYGIMAHRSDVGACGGRTIAISERPFPTWFTSFQWAYAVGQQAESEGDVTESRGYLWGAGLTVRRSAWVQLTEAGFRPLCVGRRGKSLAAGEDLELCFALRLGGWRLWYSNELLLQHHIPESRLTTSYLRRLSRGFGAANAWLSHYHMSSMSQSRVLSMMSRDAWAYRLCSLSKRLAICTRNTVAPSISKTEELSRMVLRDMAYGELMEILAHPFGHSMAREYADEFKKNISENKRMNYTDPTHGALSSGHASSAIREVRP